MEMVLLGRDLWSVVEGSELKPSTPDTRQIAQIAQDRNMPLNLRNNPYVPFFN